MAIGIVEWTSREEFGRFPGVALSQDFKAADLFACNAEAQAIAKKTRLPPLSLRAGVPDSGIRIHSGPNVDLIHGFEVN